MEYCIGASKEELVKSLRFKPQKTTQQLWCQKLARHFHGHNQSKDTIGPIGRNQNLKGSRNPIPRFPSRKGTCSISGVDLAFVSFGVPVFPSTFLGLRLLAITIYTWYPGCGQISVLAIQTSRILPPILADQTPILVASNA